MIDRFAVRRTEKGFGVWDAAVNGWHSPTDLDETTAVGLAEEMNAREANRQASTGGDAGRSPSDSARTGRASTVRGRAGNGDPERGSGDLPANGPKAPPTGTLRRVRPPRPVLILIDGQWWPGRLDMWVREADGWYGRATLDRTGAMSWYPAISLRESRSSSSSER